MTPQNSQNDNDVVTCVVCTVVEISYQIYRVEVIHLTNLFRPSPVNNEHGNRVASERNPDASETCYLKWKEIFNVLLSNNKGISFMQFTMKCSK